jgi:Protein of unknown function (DUF2934)
MSDRDQDLDYRIRLRAYLLWEAEGRPEGRADEYWHRARELIEAEAQSAYPPTQSRGHRT